MAATKELWHEISTSEGQTGIRCDKRCYLAVLHYVMINVEVHGAAMQTLSPCLVESVLLSCDRRNAKRDSSFIPPAIKSRLELPVDHFEQSAERWRLA